ncbi:hypothetical protein [Methylomonas sp. AM2-LC]|uniref:hypothetical protein n=1 Tax=Methylomonas sp. AM2-LC TaxID=3153301 RepID=UPI003266EB0F
MNHETVASRVESVSMASGIIAGISAFGATVYTPTGLSAVGVWLGIDDEPMIVILAPWLGDIATAAGVLSGCTYFYSQWKKRQSKRNVSMAESSESD